MKVQWINRLFSAALSIIFLGSVACTPENSTSDQGSDETSPSNSEATTLKLLYWQAPTILNPHLSTGLKDAEASRITLEPLASFDKDSNMVLFLADEEPTLENGGLSEDGKTIVWKLKQDILWSDGTPFTAADVVFTYEFLSNPAVGATSNSSYEIVESVIALDDHTVEVNFLEPNPAWFLVFMGPGGMILPRHMYVDYNGANVREAPANLLPIGTGPYRVTQFKPGDVIIFDPNPHYRESESLAFERVELKGGGDSTSAARAVMQTGDADFAHNIQVEANVLEQFTGTGQVDAIFGPLMERILLNQTDPNQENADGVRSHLDFPHPFLTDPNVRKAINLALDRVTIAEQLYGPTGQPTANIIVAPQTFVSENTSYRFDLDEAAALLDEAGWVDSNGNGIRDKDGVEMEMVFQTSVNSVRQKTQAIVKQALESIGMSVELKSIDASVYFSNDPSNSDTTEKFQADLQMYTTGNNSPDPGSYMQTFTCPEIPQPENGWVGYNTARYCNPEYDALWRESTIELDPDSRQDLFIEMNDLLVNDHVILPIVHRSDTVGVSDRLQGVNLTPWDQNTWNIAEWNKQ